MSDSQTTHLGDGKGQGLCLFGLGWIEDPINLRLGDSHTHTHHSEIHGNMNLHSELISKHLGMSKLKLGGFPFQIQKGYPKNHATKAIASLPDGAW